MATQNEIDYLYRQLIGAWNQRDADAMASFFSPSGTMIGFDGSTEIGPDDIRKHLAPIFRDHPTAAFVVQIREIRHIAPGAAFLRAVAGMIPPGDSDIMPAANTIQCLVASKHDGEWRIELFQNTPAAFHGRPELQDEFTAALRTTLQNQPAP